LRGDGYDTVNDALRLAETTKPDLAIVDVRLAGPRDGIEGAELLRQQFGIPVIFLTGDIDEATARRASAIDPAGYLVKPVHGHKNSGETRGPRIRSFAPSERLGSTLRRSACLLHCHVQQRLDGLANRIDAATTARLFDQVKAKVPPPADDLAAYLIEACQRRQGIREMIEMPVC
jgi:DNA-binding NarL/FixJ family response regulator